jgi:preprotein translocase subunit SecA
MRVEVMSQPPPEQQLPPMQAHHVNPLTGEDEMSLAPAQAALPNSPAPIARDANDPSGWGKVGRNEPCPCGSGKKYKHCHGKLA